MEIVQFPSPGESAGRSLVVMLPGAHIRPGDFASEGLVPALRERSWPGDAVALGLDLADYIEPDFPARLHEDVIAPALQQGYARISLMGVSLGGMGALLYARAHPELTGEVILIAPFLATSGTIGEVVAAGGLAAWQPRSFVPGDIERGLLAWLKSPEFAAAIRPRLILGYGTDDRFAEASLLLAGVMRRERVISMTGGHDWPTWRRLWRRILDETSSAEPW
jgi:pimeloyl-ACP methyl ester carboxylesterase